jgi:hypothetical protein
MFLFWRWFSRFFGPFYPLDYSIERGGHSPVQEQRLVSIRRRGYPQVRGDWRLCHWQDLRRITEPGSIQQRRHFHGLLRSSRCPWYRSIQYSRGLTLLLLSSSLLCASLRRAVRSYGEQQPVSILGFAIGMCLTMGGCVISWIPKGHSGNRFIAVGYL